MASAPWARSVSASWRPSALVVCGVAAQFGADHFLAVDAGNETAQPELAVVDDRVAAQRHLAGTAKRTREARSALTQWAVSASLSGDDLGHHRVAIDQFDTQRALPRRRQRLLRRQDGLDAILQAEADQAGSGQDDRVVLAGIELLQAGIEVAAQALDDQLRIFGAQDGLAAQAGGADHGASRQSSRPLNLFETKASRGFSRAEMAASTKPSGITIGTSFIECTARWALPSCIATSSSLMNRPLPPISASGRSRIWSPLVVMPRMTTSEPGFKLDKRSLTRNRLPHGQTGFAGGNDDLGRTGHDATMGWANRGADSSMYAPGWPLMHPRFSVLPTCAPGRSAARTGQPLIVIYSRDDCSSARPSKARHLAPMAADASAPNARSREIGQDRDTPLIDFQGKRPPTPPSPPAKNQAGAGRRLYGPNGRKLAEPIVGARLPDFYQSYLDDAIDQASRQLKTMNEPSSPPNSVPNTPISGASALAKASPLGCRPGAGRLRCLCRAQQAAA